MVLTGNIVTFCTTWYHHCDINVKMLKIGLYICVPMTMTLMSQCKMTVTAVSKSSRAYFVSE